jgi:hypothetical protein
MSGQLPPTSLSLVLTFTSCLLATPESTATQADYFIVIMYAYTFIFLSFFLSSSRPLCLTFVLAFQVVAHFDPSRRATNSSLTARHSGFSHSSGKLLPVITGQHSVSTHGPWTKSSRLFTCYLRWPKRVHIPTPARYVFILATFVSTMLSS